MATHRVAEGRSIVPAGLRAGDVVTVFRGAHPAAVIRGIKAVRWEFALGAFVDGKGAAEALRVHDGCHDLTWVNAQVKGGKCGFRGTGSARMKFYGGKFWGCSIEAAKFGACDDLLIENAAFGWGVGGNDRSHALYGASWGQQRPTIRRCRFEDVVGSGCQWNATPADGKPVIRGGLLEDCVFVNCGSGGTPALSLMGVQDSTFRRLRFEGNNRGIKMFADGSDEEDEDGEPKYACRGNRFEDIDMTAQAAPKVELLEGSGGNFWLRPVGFFVPRGDTLLNEPTEPKPDLPTDLAARLAASEARERALAEEVERLRGWERRVREAVLG